MAESGEAQAAEVSTLKERYGRECRVMKNVGEFTHVVDLRPADLDVSFKFQLSGKVLLCYNCCVTMLVSANDPNLLLDIFPS